MILTLYYLGTKCSRNRSFSLYTFLCGGDIARETWNRFVAWYRRVVLARNTNVIRRHCTHIYWAKNEIRLQSLSSARVLHCQRNKKNDAEWRRKKNCCEDHFVASSSHCVSRARAVVWWYKKILGFIEWGRIYTAIVCGVSMHQQQSIAQSLWKEYNRVIVHTHIKCYIRDYVCSTQRKTYICLCTRSAKMSRSHALNIAKLRAMHFLSMVQFESAAREKTICLIGMTYSQHGTWAIQIMRSKYVFTLQWS